MRLADIEELVLKALEAFDHQRNPRTWIGNIYDALGTGHRLRLKDLYSVLVILERLGRVQSMGIGSGKRYYLSQSERQERDLPLSPYKLINLGKDFDDPWQSLGAIEVREVVFRAFLRVVSRSDNGTVRVGSVENAVMDLVGIYPPKGLTLNSLHQFDRRFNLVVGDYKGFRLSDKGAELFGHLVANEESAE